MTLSFIQPDWPAPNQIKAFVTTREGGVSQSPFDSLNLAMHVEDNPEHVKTNRELLAKALNFESEPIWLNQQHGNTVIVAHKDEICDADGSYTDQKNVICSVLTADCVPIFLCSKNGQEVAVLHGGWRSLAMGIIDNGINKFKNPPKNLLAWLGPAISQNHYEVDDEVRRIFTHYDAEAATAFRPSRPDHWHANLYELATQRLKNCGIQHIFGGNFCTYKNKKQFYSYRRDGEKTGRMASLIWII